MAVQAFSFPVPETRFLQAGQHVYKFKITRGSNCRQQRIYDHDGDDEMIDNDFVNQELEDAIRVVLASLDSLHPFATRHFNIFPYKSKWERVSKLRFKQSGVRLSAYPFLITLYLETRDPARRHTAKHSEDWVFPVKECGLDGPQFCPSLVRQSKRSKIEQPPEGTLSQHSHQYSVTHQPQCQRDSPCLVNGAEVMVCGSRFHADSEVLAQPAPGAKNTPDEGPSPWCAAEQVVPAVPEPNSAERANPGVLVRLASAVFPLSLFFRS